MCYTKNLEKLSWVWTKSWLKPYFWTYSYISELNSPSLRGAHARFCALFSGHNHPLKVKFLWYAKENASTLDLMVGCNTNILIGKNKSKNSTRFYNYFTGENLIYPHMLNFSFSNWHWRRCFSVGQRCKFFFCLLLLTNVL